MSAQAALRSNIFFLSFGQSLQDLLATEVFMSLSMKQHLLKQLADFGLNPKEWSLSIGPDTSEVSLIHQADQSFQFIGQIDWQLGRWVTLKLPG